MLFLLVYLIMLLWYLILHGKNEHIYGDADEAINLFPKEYCPLVVWVCMLAYFLFPARKMMNGKGRRYFVSVICESLGSLCIPVLYFKHGFVTDQISSFSGAIKDFEYTTCYYWTKRHDISADTDISQCGQTSIFRNLFISLVPLSLRLIQIIRGAYTSRNQKGGGWNFKNKYNFIKYLIGVITVFISFSSKKDLDVKWIWVCVALTGTIYSFLWDIYIDFDLMKTGSNTKYKFLRPILAYNTINFYYAALLADLFLRAIWIMNLN